MSDWLREGREKGILAKKRRGRDFFFRGRFFAQLPVSRIRGSDVFTNFVRVLKDGYCILKVAFLLLHAICFCGSKQIPSPRTGKVRAFPCWQDAIKIHKLDSQQHPGKKRPVRSCRQFFLVYNLLGKSFDSFEEPLGNSVVLSRPIFFFARCLSGSWRCRAPRRAGRNDEKPKTA